MSERLSHDSSAPKILFITEAHFGQNGDQIVALDGVNGDTQWGRYQLGDCRGLVLARTKRTIEQGDPVTSMIAVPIADYQGLKSAIIFMPKVAVQILKAVRQSDVVVARVPGPLSMIAAFYAKLLGKPYAVEVVGDIHDVLSQGAIPGLKQFATLGRLITARICSSAFAGRYVTQQTLQQKYPVKSGPMIGISNVQIPDEVEYNRTRRLSAKTKVIHILAVGSQEVNYKGHDIALLALKALREDYPQLSYQLTLVGGGKLHDSLRTQAADLGLADHVHFPGHVPATQVAQFMQRADVLIQPSLTEGLPRVVIEAMAQGLPVCGSNVGGIPELVSPKFLVPPGDPKALASAIFEITDSKVYSAESERSLQESKNYLLAELDRRFAIWSNLLATKATANSRGVRTML